MPRSNKHKILIFLLLAGILFLPAQSFAVDYEWGCVDGWDGDGNPVTECGYGYWRTLCGWNAGVEECETFFEIVSDAYTSAVSNVLFLPGIKGSRLYRPSPECTGPPETCSVKLWEPYGNALAQQLFLQDNGRSIHDDVHVRAGDVLADALGQEFYASFFNDLRDAEASSAFGDGWHWEAGAYDWRLSLPDLVARGKREDNRIYYSQTSDLPYLETQLRDLAESSPTGKVTLVTHSNGGLVAKALLAALGDDEAGELVDKIVFVGVPHLGAPQALGALLYGHGEALPFDECAAWRATSWACGVLMNRTTARTFAQNAPMAYHLLPSEAYFERGPIEYPIARFVADSLYAPERQQYGATIDTEEELHAFAAAREGGRSAPAPEDLGKATVLSESLLAYAHDAHVLDAWQPPTGIEAYYLVGWGKETISGIEFYEEPDVLGLFGAAIPRYRPLFMFEGDGVVPAASAEPLTTDSEVHPTAVHASILNSQSNTYWIDLAAINEKRLGSDRGHGTLFEADAVLHLLTQIIVGTLSAAALPDHASAAVPAPDESRHWLRIFLHSPLTLELYDGTKHLGFTENGTFDDQIEDATYGEFGEVKYITAPADRDYKLRLRAEGTGSFSLDIQEERGQESTTTSIVQVPVQVGDVAYLALSGEPGETLNLELDRTDDGTMDEEVIALVGTTTPFIPPERQEEMTRHPQRNTGSEASATDQAVEEATVVSAPLQRNASSTTTRPTIVKTSSKEILTAHEETDNSAVVVTDKISETVAEPAQEAGPTTPDKTWRERYQSVVLGILLLLLLGYAALRRLT